MHLLKTVLLRHRMRGGDHYDWLLEPPDTSLESGPGDPRLLTWRLGLPSWHWRQRCHGGRAMLEMQELVAHRRAYLRRTGAVSGRRGVVQRVDAGDAVIRNWHEDGGHLELRLRHFGGLVELRRCPGLRWRMRVEE